MGITALAMAVATSFFFPAPLECPGAHACGWTCLLKRTVGKVREGGTVCEVPQ